MTTPGWSSILLTTMLAWSPPGESPDVEEPVSFQLQDFRGAWHRPEEAGKGKVVVIAFLGTECPLASLYAPRLAELARAYEKKGVAFFGVDSNQQDAPSSHLAVRPRARPAVPDAQGRGQRAGRPAGRRADARGLRPGRRPGRALSRAGWTTSSASACTARRRRSGTSPRRSTTCWPAGRSPRRGPSLSAAGSAGSRRAGGMRPSRTRSRLPASSATVASPATARARSRRSRSRRTSRPPAGPR